MGWLGNEHEVGQGIKDSGVPREKVFITSKLWNTHQPNVADGLQKTLDALGTDYLDLYVTQPSCFLERAPLIQASAHPLASPSCSCKFLRCSHLSRHVHG